MYGKKGFYKKTVPIEVENINACINQTLVYILPSREQLQHFTCPSPQ